MSVTHASTLRTSKEFILAKSRDEPQLHCLQDLGAGNTITPLNKEDDRCTACGEQRTSDDVLDMETSNEMPPEVVRVPDHS